MMHIDFPEHPNGRWRVTPWYLLWRPFWRRKRWRWTVDHHGCECKFYWQYADLVEHADIRLKEENDNGQT